MTERKVLVIEPDCRRAQSRHNILRRLSCQPIVVADITAIARIAERLRVP